MTSDHGFASTPAVNNAPDPASIVMRCNEIQTGAGRGGLGKTVSFTC